MARVSETEDRVADAITAAVIEDYGEEFYVASWVLVAEVMGQDGNPEPMTMTSGETSWVNTLGLLEAGRLLFQANFFEEKDSDG
jgi:hypothetical protein